MEDSSSAHALASGDSVLLEMEEEQANKPSPFLKWAGGKRQLLPDLVKRLPNKFACYHEPFVGGGALFFNLLPGKACLNDSNAELINVYQVVKSQVDELIDDLKKHVYDADYYYSLRNADRTDDYQSWTNVAKASRFLYLNKTCFNGLYRVNRKGYFNVPFGRYKNPKILDRSNLLACSKCLQNVELTTQSFLNMEPSIQAGDFVYCDPPYLPISETSNFTSYHSEGFDLDMHIELRNFCKRISEKGAFFLLSNSSSDIVPQLYKDFKVKKVLANRAINSQGSKRGEVQELLISNY